MFKKLFDITVWKFLLVGVANTLVGAGIMFILYNIAGCSYWLSSAANYVFGGILSFFLNKYFTFRKTEWSWGQVLRFAINVIACWAIAYGFAKPFVSRLLDGRSKSLQENAAMIVGLVLYTGLNYLGQRFFAFRDSEEKK